MSYVDTSVIVAALDSEDPRQVAAIKALEKRREKVVSELVLLELASILTRRRLLEGLARSLGVDMSGVLLPAVLLYIMRRFGLRYTRVEGFESYHFLVVNTPVSRALRLLGSVNLRTLDLLHLAYIEALKNQEENLEELLTVDEDFLREAKKIENLIGVKVTQPAPT